MAAAARMAIAVMAKGNIRIAASGPWGARIQIRLDKKEIIPGLLASMGGLSQLGFESARVPTHRRDHFSLSQIPSIHDGTP